MKTISSDVRIAFNAIDFEDAIAIIPIMDDLVSNINDLAKTIENFEALPPVEKQENDSLIEARYNVLRLIKQYKVLHKLGFASQYELIKPIYEFK